MQESNEFKGNHFQENSPLRFISAGGIVDRKIKIS